MIDPRFFPLPRPMPLAEVARLTGAELLRGDPETEILGAAPLETAGPHELTFIDNPKYARHLASTRAGACLCAPRHADRVAAGVAVLQTGEPYRAYAAYLAAAVPAAVRPSGSYEYDGASRAGTIHPQARLEDEVVVEPGAVVAAGAEIGRGTVIAAGAVIAPGVAVGRDCSIGPNVTLQHALIGDRVIIHPGVRIGQDGFGFAMGPAGHRKVAQLGRVIIQDDVEIGANTTIDRGANKDTMVGEGTKIDNQVQIGHNVRIGRHCIIVAQVGISGSATLGDFVAVGGQTGINGHVTIGDGAQIAAASAVNGDVPPGERWGGVPARPFVEWLRDERALRRLARRAPAGKEET
ncbi:MAG TPA: UDP-3-O-(3-hydroxymyristoyl)glucosamine N-acyltransferase [Afifellaceae bacterium]|nr:UDP-3-O-(3-hydroxymyristoyl)glucosamine N-acyltransferase [Afifellaceae bacterium]